MPRFKEGPDPEQKHAIPGEIKSEKKVQLEEYNKLFKALNEILGKPKGVTESNNFIGYVSRDIIENIAKALTEKNQLTRNELIEIIRTTKRNYTEDYIDQLANEIIGRIENAAPFRPFKVEGTTIVKNTEEGTDNEQTLKVLRTPYNNEIDPSEISQSVSNRSGQTKTNQPNQTQNRKKVDLNKIPKIVPKHTDQTETNQLPETKNNEKLVYSIINYSDKNKKILDINITEQDRKQFLNIKSFYNGELSQKQIEFFADQEYTITIPVDEKYINKVKKTLDNLKEKFEADKLIVLPEIKAGQLMITLAPIFNFEIINIESPPLTVSATIIKDQEKLLNIKGVHYLGRIYKNSGEYKIDDNTIYYIYYLTDTPEKINNIESNLNDWKEKLQNYDIFLTQEKLTQEKSDKNLIKITIETGNKNITKEIKRIYIDHVPVRVDNTTKPKEQEKSTTKQDNKSTQEVQTEQPQELYKPPKTISQRNEEKTTEQKSKSTQKVETEESIVKYTIGSEEEWNNLKQEIINEVNAGKKVQIEFTDEDGLLIWKAEDDLSDKKFSKVKIGDILTITKK